jgi:hypothetical protein
MQDGKYLCLSLPYLVYKMRTDIQEIIREEVYKKNIPNPVQNAIGKAYEHYITQQLTKTYSALSHRIIKGVSNKIEIADGVIDYGDQLIFIEVKSSRLRIRERLSNDNKIIREGLDPYLVTDGAKQINDRIMNFKEGVIHISHIKPYNIRRFWPLLITCVDFLPMMLGLTEYYYKILQENDVLTSSDIAPLSIITLDEFDMIMDLVNSGHSFIELLKDKTINSEYRYISFHAYIQYKGYNINRHSESLEEAFMVKYDVLKKLLGFKR